MQKNYVEYGRRLEKLIGEGKAELRIGVAASTGSA